MDDVTRNSPGPAAGWITPRYLLWLAVANVSQLGNGVIGFAIAWTATGLGAGLAGTVAAVGLVPTVALLLLGGSLGDRLGQRRLLVATTVAEVVQYLAFWLLLGWSTTSMVWLLVGNAVAVGTLQGLTAPSTNVVGRQYVAPEHVRPAISVSTTVGSLVRIASPTLGALCLAVVGLRGTVLLQAASFIGMLAVLVTMPPGHQPPRTTSGTRVHHDIWTGLRSVAASPAARSLLLATMSIAAAILPFTGLGLPMLARSRGWYAATAGELAGVWTIGSVATTMAVTARYARHPDAAPTGMVAGPAVAAASLAGVALCPDRWGCAALCLAMGIGTALFTAHASPTLVALAPADQQSRWSAATVLAQFLPLLLVNPGFGAAVQRLGATWPLVGLAGLATLGGCAAARAHHALVSARRTETFRRPPKSFASTVEGMTTHRYPVTLSWEGATSSYRSYSRNHHAAAGGLGLGLSADPAFRGDPGEWNPELLLVAAASSCQLLSFLAVAARAGVTVVGYQDDAEGTMPDSESPVRIARIQLRPRITVQGDAARATVLGLVEQAHEECYVANSLACPVDVDATVEVV